MSLCFLGMKTCRRLRPQGREISKHQLLWPSSLSHKGSLGTMA